MKRTHHCGALRKRDVGETVVLMGWVHSDRDHGGLIFIDLRDREGITQVVFNPESDKAVYKQAKTLRGEDVIAVYGKVNRRPAQTENPQLKTGDIELQVERLEILNRSKTPPFQIEDQSQVSENLRLKYRYLDLRNPGMRENLIKRHRLVQSARRYLEANNFIEIETPFLTRSTPEGARDYLVPSRINPGRFFALPQSPQLFKQILMVSGMERYYQIARCFRDEDLRADRQPEFTQIDLELSFTDRDEVISLMEGMIREIFRSVNGIDLGETFPRMTFKEAMDRFGTDRPDLR
ncbi:MAG TPA: aspartate--tRNA ligase, partial [Nitrospiria bacterium]